MLKYIDENLNKIIENPESVMYLRPYDIGGKRALFAIVKEDQGVYKKVQITKEQFKGNFPFEPISWFYKGPGYFYLKDFIVFNNWLALNITNLEGFKHSTLDESKIFKVGIYATFNDGSATFVERKTSKEFQKKGGIQAYIDLLKPHKEYTPKYDTYRNIEGYYNHNDDTIVIPELLAPKDLELKKINYEELKLQSDESTMSDKVQISSDSVKDSVKKLTRIKNKKR